MAGRGPRHRRPPQPRSVQSRVMLTGRSGRERARERWPGGKAQPARSPVRITSDWTKSGGPMHPPLMPSRHQLSFRNIATTRNTTPNTSATPTRANTYGLKYVSGP